MVEGVFSLETLLYLCGAIVTIASAAGVISKVVKKSFEKSLKQSVNEYYKVYSASFDSKLEELSKEIHEYIQSQNSSNTQVLKALLASTRDRINQAHDYYTKLGYIGAHSLFVVEELYTSYKELGGNSFVDRQMEDIRDLKVISAESVEDKS